MARKGEAALDGSRMRSGAQPGARAGTGGRPARLVGVEGLRAVAACTILVYHVWLYGDVTGEPVPVGPLQPLFENLQGGVTLFFALSGFLLFRPWVEAALDAAEARGSGLATGRPPIKAYFQNRALRLVPAYWTVLFATAAVANHGLLRHPLQLLSNATLTSFSVPGWVVPNMYGHDVGGPIAIWPAWSLAVEVVFYVLVPVLGLLALRLAQKGRAPGWVAALAPAALLALVGLAGKAVFSWGISGDTRLMWDLAFPLHGDWFATGMAVAVVRALRDRGAIRVGRPWKLAAAAGCLGFAALGAKAFSSGLLNPVAAQTPVAIACGLLLLLVVLAEPGTRTVRALGSRPVVAVGLASYSIFLWHDPLVRWLREQGVLHAGTQGFLANLAIVGAITAVLATLSYRFVEAPALRLKKRTAVSPPPPPIEAPQPAHGDGPALGPALAAAPAAALVELEVAVELER